MKRLLLLTSALILSAAAAFAAGPFDGLEPVTLRYGNGAGEGTAGDLWGTAFCKYVSEITGGKLTVDYLNNGSLGSDSEMQTQMQNGDIDIVSCQPGQTATFVPAAGVYDLPLVFARYDAATIENALNYSAFADMMNGKYRERGIICLGLLQGGTFRVMTSSREIRAVGDISGINIRTMNSPNQMAFWKALDANPRPMALKDFLSLGAGAMDAQENANDTNVSVNIDTLHKYLVNTRHVLYINQFMMNLAKFEGLAPAYQQAIRSALARATADTAPMLAAIDAEDCAKLVGAGMTNITFDDTFYSALIRKAQPVYAEIRAQIGDDIVDALIGALEGK